MDRGDRTLGKLQSVALACLDLCDRRPTLSKSKV